MSKVRILIIEDELLVAEEMSNMLSSHGYSVLEIVDNTNDARRALEMYQLDILLIDIKLKGEENGISLAKHVSTAYSLPVIFITSFIDPETVNKAIEAKPSAYLVKPYNHKELRIAISIALDNFQNNKISSSHESSESLDSHYLLNQHIFIKDKHRLERVDFEDILWMKAESSYVNVATEKKEYLLTSDTLGSFLERVNCEWMLRVHRSFAVNTHKIEAIDGNRLSLNSIYIPIGKNYKSAVKQHLNIL